MEPSESHLGRGVEDWLLMYINYSLWSSPSLVSWCVHHLCLNSKCVCMVAEEGQVPKLNMDYRKKFVENLFKVLMGMIELISRRLELIESEREVRANLA